MSLTEIDLGSVKGPAGPSGTAFVPTVDSDGNLSWANDGGLSNPATVNIKGPKGDTGAIGPTGATGAQGATGATGADGPSNISESTATALIGLLKGNGANVQRAVAGTDYAVPSKSFSGTFTAAGWSGSTAPYTQVLSLSGITADMAPIVDIALTGTTDTDVARLEAWGYVGRIVCGANTLTATCYASKPTVDLPVTLKVVG